MTNEPQPRGDGSPLPPTPALDRLIERVRARLSALVVLHGLGTTLAVASAWFAFAFLADWILHLPAPVRVFHLLVLVALPAFAAWRALVRPFRARPDAAGTAVLVERAHPGHAEILVTAVELARSPAPSGDRAHVESVLRDADRVAASLDASVVLDVQRPRTRALLGVAAAAGALALLFLNPAAAATFLARIAGGATPWPQETRLAIEIPVTGAEAAAAADSSGEIVVRVARGADVPVLVRAEGVVPEEVVLHFDGGHRSVLGSAGGPVFRTLLRSVQEDVAFHATGGDDLDATPRARLVVLEPPDIVRVAVAIEPPAYSGLPARVEADPDVEVLRGSRVIVHAATTPADVSAKVRFLPEDRVLDLAPARFPDAEAAPSQAFEIVAESNMRYRFELLDAQGLANPDPGLFGITVVEDRPPEIEVLSPGRGDFDTVAGGAIPLRVRVTDDFRVARVGYEVAVTGTQPGSATLVDVEWRALTSAERADAEAETRLREARSAVFARTRLEVADLAARMAAGDSGPDTTAPSGSADGAPAAGPALEGLQFQLVVRALDAAEPTAHEGRAAPVRVRVVQPEEFLRRVQDRLARAQGQATALLELQREKRRLLLEMLTALSSDAPGVEDAEGDLSTALLGGRRVQGDARALARDLAGAAESVLYARVDDRAGSALDLFEAAHQDSVLRGFDPAPWRTFAASVTNGDAAGAGLASKLVDIAALALEVGEDHATSAVNDLSRAADATDLARVRAHLVAAEQAQARVVDRLERLLERLAEWDNFQSVLGLTRDILNGQKALRERTRENAKEK